MLWWVKHIRGGSAPVARDDREMGMPAAWRGHQKGLDGHSFWSLLDHEHFQEFVSCMCEFVWLHVTFAYKADIFLNEKLAGD
jgi:hypothetical protein